MVFISAMIIAIYIVLCSIIGFPLSIILIDDSKLVKKSNINYITIVIFWPILLLLLIVNALSRLLLNLINIIKEIFDDEDIDK